MVLNEYWDKKKSTLSLYNTDNSKKNLLVCDFFFFISPDTFYRTVPVTLTVASKICCCAVGTPIISCSSLHTCTKSCYSAIKILVSWKKSHKYCQITISVTCTIYVSFILRHSLEFVFLVNTTQLQRLRFPILFKQNSLSALSRRPILNSNLLWDNRLVNQGLK